MNDDDVEFNLEIIDRKNIVCRMNLSRTYLFRRIGRRNKTSKYWIVEKVPENWKQKDNFRFSKHGEFTHIITSINILIQFSIAKIHH